MDKDLPSLLKFYSFRQAVPIQQLFDLDLALNRIRQAVSDFPKAVMFELTERGFDSPNVKDHR